MEIKRRIFVEKDIDRSLCITIDELKTLFDFFPACSPYRLAFMIMATVGLRPSEVCDLTVANIINDFRYLRYKVRRPVNKFYRKTSTLVTIYKKRTREIHYSTLRNELKSYCLKNYQRFSDGRLFRFDQSTFHKLLSLIRKKIKAGQLSGKTWQGFLDLAQDRVMDFWAPNDSFKQRYRITAYSCRRFYNTYKLWCEYGGNIVLSTRDLGHTRVDTNMIYSYSPEKIGLREEDIAAKRSFDALFSPRAKGQLSLSEF